MQFKTCKQKYFLFFSIIHNITYLFLLNCRKKYTCKPCSWILRETVCAQWKAQPWMGNQETFVVELATGLLQSLPQNCLAWCVLEGGGQWPWKPEIINWKYNILKFKMHLSINVYFTSIIDESIYWNFSLKRSWQFLQMLAVASIFKQYRVSCAASFWGALFRTYLVSEVYLFLMKQIMYCSVLCYLYSILC